MRKQIEMRLAALRREYETGVAQVQELESRLVSLRQTVLRISGAILVLEELLSTPESMVDSKDPALLANHP
jgi:hypothetical protein